MRTLDQSKVRPLNLLNLSSLGDVGLRFGTGFARGWIESQPSSGQWLVFSSMNSNSTSPHLVNNQLVPVVQRVDSVIPWINHHPMDKYYQNQEPMSRSFQLPYVTAFLDWSIFSTSFPLWKKGSSGSVTQWRRLTSCDWLWHSHGSLIQSGFDPKINRSMNTPWQEYSGVACSCS